MIRVHHLNNSRSQRVLWLLEEIGAPYDVVRYQRNPATTLAPKSLKKIHPLGKSPVLEDGARTFAETGLIIQYLAETYQPLFAPKPGSDLHWRYLYWLHYAEGSAMPPLLLKLVLDKMGPLGWPAQGFVKGQLALHLDHQERELAGPWFLGESFSAADVMMSFPIEAAAERGALGGKHPHLRGFLQRIHARPAYQRALARGGPYAFATAGTA